MPFPDLAEMQQIALAFCQPPKQAQVVTMDGNGLPTGRTIRAELNPDWTVDFLTNPNFHRLRQVKSNPAMLVIWTDPPGPKYIPVIFAKGRGEVLEGDAVAAWYERRLADKGPYRNLTVEDIRKYGLIRFVASEFRFEGFPKPGEELTWDEIRLGLRWKVPR